MTNLEKEANHECNDKETIQIPSNSVSEDDNHAFLNLKVGSSLGKKYFPRKF